MNSAAQGTYHYWKNGARLPIEETSTWAGATISGARVVDGKTLLKVTAHYSQRRCTGFKVSWATANDTIQARYRLQGEQLIWQRSTDAAEQSLSVPRGTQLFPLIRAASGYLIRNLAHGHCPVMVPNIRPDADANEQFAPLISERSATLEADTADNSQWRYRGGEYGDAGCKAWLDAHDRMTRYVWDAPDGQWVVKLVLD